MDYAQLRSLLEPLITGLKDAGTHTMLPTLCGELGLPAPTADGSKRERMASSFEAVGDTDLPVVARKLLVRHPVFSMVSLHAAAKGRPKNLIFASPDKPDLRFRDALDNDVEIVTNADKVLVYDRPIGNDGLCWNDLQQWWSDTEQIADATQAKRSLYTRLKASLTASATGRNASTGCTAPPPACSTPGCSIRASSTGSPATPTCGPRSCTCWPASTSMPARSASWSCRRTKPR